MTSELYLIIDRDGVLRERSAGDMTKAETIRDILSGQFDTIAHIYCLNPGEGSCRDVTEDIARDILNAALKPLIGAALELVETEIGIAAAKEVM